MTPGPSKAEAEELNEAVLYKLVFEVLVVGLERQSALLRAPPAPEEPALTHNDAATERQPCSEATPQVGVALEEQFRCARRTIYLPVFPGPSRLSVRVKAQNAGDRIWSLGCFFMRFRRVVRRVARLRKLRDLESAPLTPESVLRAWSEALVLANTEHFFDPGMQHPFLDVTTKFVFGHEAPKEPERQQMWERTKRERIAPRLNDLLRKANGSSEGKLDGKMSATSVCLLHFAVQTAHKTNDLTYIQRVLDMGAKLNIYAKYFMFGEEHVVQALHVAVHIQYEDGVRRLIEKNAKVDSLTIRKCLLDQSPLHIALRGENKGMAAILEDEFNANIHMPDQKARTPVGLLGREPTKHRLMVHEEQRNKWVNNTKAEMRTRKGADIFLDWATDLREDTVNFNINELHRDPFPTDTLYKRKKIELGCFIHWAVIRAGRARKQSSEKSILLRALENKADVEARAHFFSFQMHGSCSALHIAVAVDFLAEATLLVEHGAFVEIPATLGGRPHYTPLSDGVFEGSVRCVEYLLSKKADPSLPNIDGRNCVHTLVRTDTMLKETSSGAKLLDRLVECRGNLTTEDTFGDTPLDLSRKAARHYTPEDLANLMPSFRHQRSLFHDMKKLAERKRAKEALALLVIAEKDEALVSRSREEALEMRCYTGTTGAVGKDPRDYICSVLSEAPRVGVQLLNMLMLDPATKDDMHGALPVRADLSRRSWLSGVSTLPFLTYYHTDYRETASKDGQAVIRWPLWYFDLSVGDTDPRVQWHFQLAPESQSKLSRGEQSVRIKVLALGNGVNLKMINAICNMDYLEGFAELPVQAIINSMWMIVAPWLKVEQMVAFGHMFTLCAWAFLPDDRAFSRWVCWTVVAACVIRQIAQRLLVYWSQGVVSWDKVRSSRLLGRLVELAMLLSNMRLLRVSMLSLHSYSMVDNACAAKCSAALSQFEVSLPVIEHLDCFLLQSEVLGNPRILLGWVIMFKFIELSFLFDCDEEFGNLLLCIYGTFPKMGSMFSLTATYFLFFCMAFIVAGGDAIESSEALGASLLELFKGLILADGDGLAQMGKSSKMMLIGSSIVFTLLIMNLIVAVFSNEYDKEVKNVHLNFWRGRASRCDVALMRPAWVWSVSERMGQVDVRYHLEQYVGKQKEKTQLLPVYLCYALSWFVKKTALALEPFRPVLKTTLWPVIFLLDGLRRMLSGRLHHKCDELAIPSKVLQMREMIHLMGHLAVAIVGVALCFFMVDVIPQGMGALIPATLLAVMIMLVQALVIDDPWLCSDHEHPRFLWVCANSEFDPNDYITQDVEKEHIDSVQMRISLMQEQITDLETNVQSQLQRLEGMFTRLLDTRRRPSNFRQPMTNDFSE